MLIFGIFHLAAVKNHRCKHTFSLQTFIFLIFNYWLHSKSQWSEMLTTHRPFTCNRQMCYVHMKTKMISVLFCICVIFPAHAWQATFKIEICKYARVFGDKHERHISWNFQRDKPVLKMLYIIFWNMLRPKIKEVLILVVFFFFYIWLYSLNLSILTNALVRKGDIPLCQQWIIYVLITLPAQHDE